MLSIEKICKLWGDVDGTHNGYAPFARAIEREATAPLIKQIKEDEALMRHVLVAWRYVCSCEDWEPGNIAEFEALRQRLEAGK